MNESINICLDCLEECEVIEMRYSPYGERGDEYNAEVSHCCHGAVGDEGDL